MKTEAHDYSRTTPELRNAPVSRSERRMVQSREIIKGLINGLNYGQIASKLGLDVSQVYRIRQSIEFEEFFDDLIDRHFEDIDTMSKVKTTYERVHALQERGKMLRAVVPRRIESKSLNVNVMLSERRAKSEEFFNRLREKDPETYRKVLEIMLDTE